MGNNSIETCGFSPPYMCYWDMHHNKYPDWGYLDLSPGNSPQFPAVLLPVLLVKR